MGDDETTANVIKGLCRLSVKVRWSAAALSGGYGVDRGVWLLL